MVRDKCRDLAACFAWKRVRLGFSSLASRLAEVWHRWFTWHHRRGCMEMKLKTDGSMRQNFAIFIVLGHKGSLVISFSIISTPRACGEVRTQSSLSHPLGFRSLFC
jgi:hypothetical protein